MANSKAYMAEYNRAYYAKNRERELERHKKHYSENAGRLRADAQVRSARRWKENREKVLGEGRRWRNANLEQVRKAGRERSKKFRTENPQEARRRIADWERRNRDKVQGYTRKRRKMRMEAVGSHTQDDLTKILNLQKNACANCFTKFDGSVIRTLDHIVALSNGGSENPDNLQFLCKSCNCKKSDLDHFEFARRNGRLL